MDPVTTRAIQIGWEIAIQLYPCWWFRFIDTPNCAFGSSSVWTWARTRRDDPELLLTHSVNGNLRKHPVQLHFQCCWITPCKFISEFTWSWPPSSSPFLLDYSLQLHLDICSFMVSNCICKLLPSQPRSVSPSSLVPSLQVLPHTRWITVWTCTFKLTQSWLPFAFQILLDRSLQMYL